MESNLRTLGKSESKVVLTLREQGRSLVNTTDILTILGADMPESAARKIIRNLIRKGWISRIVGGKYMLLPPEHGPENLGENNSLALATAAVMPSYIGWWSAAAFHGYTTQKPMAVFVAVLQQTRPQVIESSNVRFVKVTPRKFFGHQQYNVYGRSVPISSPEKTLIDCIDRPDLTGGAAELARVTHNALAEINLQELLVMVQAMKSKALLQRLGFLADLVGKPFGNDVRQSLKQAIPVSYRSHFGRAEPRDGDMGYVAAWGLSVNARKSDLLAEVPRIKSTKIH